MSSGEQTEIERFDHAHSKRVERLKLALPIAIGLSILVLVVILFINQETINESIGGDTRSNGLKAGDAAHLMTTTKFSGLDQDGRPYEITADQIARVSATSAEMMMIKPDARLFQNQQHQKWSALSSEKGLYDPSKALLALDGAVTFEDYQGNKLITPDLNVDLSLGKAVGNKTVVGYGPAGSVRAKGLIIEQHGNMIQFTGPAILRIKSEL